MAMIKKDQRAGRGCVITLFSIAVLLPTILGLLAIMGTDYQWLMLKSYIVVFPLAWASFLTGFWKPLIGGGLLIVTGLITMVGHFIIIASTPEIYLDAILFIPLAMFIGSTLLISGYSFITSQEVREE